MDGFLVVVSCGDQKIWRRQPHAGPTPAQDAYTSSKFRKSRSYAERFAERWVVLSAKYGFVEPSSIIPDNYNLTFSDPDAISVDGLKEQAARAQLDRFKIVGVLGPDVYWRRAKAAFEGSSVTLRHINGNVSFPPLFHTLIGDLIAKGTPFREGRQ